MCDRSIRRRFFLIFASLVFGAGLSSLEAADQPRVVVGKYLSAAGRLNARVPGSQQWQVVKPDEPVYRGDMLLGKPGAAIDSANGAVRLILLADLRRSSPYPTLEPAVVLHSNEKVDLDFTLDRGRVVFINRKKEGSARVRVRFRDDFWDLTLKEPETRVGMEIYGRWPRGIYWHKGDKQPETPTSMLTMIVLKGEVQLRHHQQSHLMRPPPGPALIQWDSAAGDNPSPIRLETLPSWADKNQPLSARAKKMQGLLNFFSDRQAEVGVARSIREALGSSDPAFRRVGVISLGATDNLPALIDLMGDVQAHDVRDDVVLVLRHWIGRGPGQDQKLHEALLQKKYTPVQADTILHLLHSFGPTALARPETFETLIHYLQHDKLIIRELAEYHLYRLVPAGKGIAYNPAGTPAQREAAFKEWKKLIPDGQLPSRPKEEKQEEKFKE